MTRIEACPSCSRMQHENDIYRNYHGDRVCIGCDTAGDLSPIDWNFLTQDLKLERHLHLSVDYKLNRCHILMQSWFDTWCDNERTEQSKMRSMTGMIFAIDVSVYTDNTYQVRYVYSVGGENRLEHNRYFHTSGFEMSLDYAKKQATRLLKRFFDGEDSRAHIKRKFRRKDFKKMRQFVHDCICKIEEELINGS